MARDNSLRTDRGSGAARARGRLKIGDDWNAITIIALSQSNPLKAVAELIENSIDAKSRSVTVTRGREGGRHYLSIRDDGEGVPRDEAGLPDFRYVATHICDSVKRRLKQDGVAGLQGEFAGASGVISLATNFTTSRDDNLVAGLDPVEQLAEPGLGFERADLTI